MQWWSDGPHLYTEAEYGRTPVEVISVVEVVVEVPVQAVVESPTVMEESVESPTSEGTQQGIQPGEMWSSRRANERARRIQLEGGMEVDFEAGGLPTPSEEVPSARAMVAGMQDMQD